MNTTTSIIKILEGFDIALKARELKILILSDLHFKGVLKESVDEKKERKKIETSLVAHFNSFVKKDPKEKIDIVFIVGDLSNHSDCDGYTCFIEFLSKLKKNPLFSHSIFYSCPGNHDLERYNKFNHKLAV